MDTHPVSLREILSEMMVKIKGKIKKNDKSDWV
jgi:hypothetical protein